MEKRQLKTELALEQTKEATEAIKEIKDILKHALKKNYKIDRAILKEEIKFHKQKPQLPKLLNIPKPPDKNAPFYKQYINKLGEPLVSSKRDWMFPGASKKEIIIYAENMFKSDYDCWLEEKEEIVLKNKKLEKQYQEELSKWEAEEKDYLAIQERKNAIYKQYFDKQPNVIIPFCEIILSDSEYPHYFPQEFDLDYNPETKILIVDYSLPPIDALPRLKEVKYIKTSDEFSESFFADSTVNNLYDDLIYQITLRTIHELYESDVVNAIDSIIFNGIVESIDKATGQNTTACIVSVQANKQEFLSINLEHVDPKACFKKLKGIGSSKLHSLTPIAPILSINREDKRFVSSYQVVDELGDTYNLAAMDWEDFEHLIRELFEKEFSQSGGEVKVTRSSRDAGVDAVAFDPDPIRGGKIVIQAKRYTNTVGVSAVRDLYGTIMNEGATKGILVSTADYGPDAYEFAKGKPLTLLNGSNLLHLLEKHGHKAKIDLKEAKQILAEQEKQKNNLNTK
ncbi:restriction endonuclease [Candidatus Kuenenia sp.]|uniref:restriction endonuclease n=1 Tax=Candidatus Kuenenia sp. TaxID=2499824 RepID=UPI0032205033